MSELTQWEDSGCELFDVMVKVDAGDSNEVFGERDSGGAVVVLLLECGSVGAVVGAMVGSEGVGEFHLGDSTETLVVRHERGGAADSEDAVGDKHGAVVAAVPVQADALGDDDKGVERLAAGAEYLRR